MLLPQSDLDAQVSLCGNILCVSATSVSSIDCLVRYVAVICSVYSQPILNL